MFYTFRGQGIDECIEIDQQPILCKNADPHAQLRFIHKNVPQPFYSFFMFAGRRIIALDSELLNNRRIRIYHTVVVHDTVHIQYGWIKIAPTTLQDRANIAALAHQRLLWQGSKFVVSVGGNLYPYRRLHLLGSIH